MTFDKLNARIKKNLIELYFNKIVKVSENSNNSINFHINTKNNKSESTEYELSQKFFIFENQKFSIIKKNAQSICDQSFKY